MPSGCTCNNIIAWEQALCVCMWTQFRGVRYTGVHLTQAYSILLAAWKHPAGSPIQGIWCPMWVLPTPQTNYIVWPFDRLGNYLADSVSNCESQNLSFQVTRGHNVDFDCVFRWLHWSLSIVFISGLEMVFMYIEQMVQSPHVTCVPWSSLKLCHIRLKYEHLSKGQFTIWATSWPWDCWGPSLKPIWKPCYGKWNWIMCGSLKLEWKGMCNWLLNKMLFCCHLVHAGPSTQQVILKQELWEFQGLWYLGFVLDPPLWSEIDAKANSLKHP